MTDYKQASCEALVSSKSYATDLIGEYHGLYYHGSKMEQWEQRGAISAARTYLNRLIEAQLNLEKAYTTKYNDQIAA